MLKILAGSVSKSFGQKVAESFGGELVPVKTTRFSDGEFTVSIEKTIRGKEVAIVQSTFPPTDNLMELLLLVDAAKRASAKRIIAVIPYFGFARQDRKDKPRVAIGAKLVANLLMAAGIDRLITMDCTRTRFKGFLKSPLTICMQAPYSFPTSKASTAKTFASLRRIQEERSAQTPTPSISEWTWRFVTSSARWPIKSST